MPSARGQQAPAPAARAEGDAKDFGADGPTVVCDGKGGYRVESYGRQKALLTRCYVVHEQAHLADLQKICPTGCKGQPDGALHGNDAPRCPAFKDAAAYNAWRRESECRAYSAEKLCLRGLVNEVKTEQKKGTSTLSYDQLNEMLSTLRLRAKKARCSRAFHKCGDEGDEQINYLTQCTGGTLADIPPGF